MTLQQQLASRIYTLSDEGVKFVDMVLNNMNPNFFMITVNTQSSNKKSVKERRFGIAKDILDACPDLDKHNDEIAKLFEGDAE